MITQLEEMLNNPIIRVETAINYRYACLKKEIKIERKIQESLKEIAGQLIIKS